MKKWLLCASCLLAFDVVAAAVDQPIVISGTVADEAGKAALLARLREVFGSERVVDQLSIGKVSAPANWNAYVQKLIGPNLKAIRAGQLKIDGNTVSVRGDVDSDAQRQQIGADMAASLNATYTVSNGLRVQQIVIPLPLNGTVEFESGKAVLTARGRAILDDVIVQIQQGQYGNVNVIGHTDNHGDRELNLALSLARAEAVKAYAVGKGLAPASITASGEGPDRPIADNQSAAGRASNRRIEFRVVR